MWRRIKFKGRFWACYKQDGRTEVYNEGALTLNIQRLEQRLVDERQTLDILNGGMIEASIEHLKSGLDVLVNANFKP